MHPGADAAERTGVRAFVAATGLAVAFVVVLLLTRDLGLLAQVLSNVGLLVVALAASLACARSARRCRGRLAQMWWLLAAAAFSWACGMTVWTVRESVLGLEPVASPADVGFVASMVLIVAALLRLPAGSTGTAGRLRALVDGLLIACSTLIVSWVLVLREVVETDQRQEGLELVLALAYPLGDVLIVTLVVHVLLRHREGARAPAPLGAIGAALVSLSVADSAFAYLVVQDTYASGSLVDGFWFLGYALLAAAAGRQQPVSDVLVEVPVRALGLFVPYLPVLLALAVSSWQVLKDGHLDLASSWGRAALLLLLVVRQVLALRENLGLTTHLEGRVAQRTAELSASRARFEALVQHSHDVTTILDRDGEVRYVSRSGARLFGHDEQVVGRPYEELVDPRDVPELRRVLDEVSVEPLAAATLGMRLLHRDGSLCDVETTVTNLLDEPSVGGYVLNTRDVSERQALERRLLHEATHDALTGLANRSLFEARVAGALHRAAGQPGRIAVIFLDLDGFKAINDSLGHEAGDQLLCAVAARLRSCVRGTDLVARLGGDEFGVLLEGLEGEDRAVELTTRLTERLRHIVVVQGRKIAVQGSVGVAVALGTEEPGELLRNADLAMYRAKSAREGGHAVFDPGMHADLVQRLDLESDLRAALAGDPRESGFAVYYQPVISLDSGRVVAMEALARWNHPERGPVPPSVFVPIAEESGLIHALGRFVLVESCIQARAWRRRAPDGAFSVTVNLSGRQLARDDMVDELREVLADTGLPPEALVIEMTESVLLEHAEGVRERLVRIRALGVRLAVDDFGTGYSSLSYLHRFPVDVLKIDRSFVGRLGGALPEDALVPTIVSLASAMRLTAIAEGVENEEQALALRRLGCEYGQGYHFAPAVPADRFPEIVAELSRRPVLA